MVDYVWEILDVSPSGDNLPDGGQKLINNWAVVSSTFTIDDTTFDLTLGADLTVVGTLSASAVAITGGTISGITDLALADGGTGSSTAAGARTNLDVDQAGTDNSTDVTLAGAPNYITIVGQVITRALINLASHITGILPLANGGTGSATVTAAEIAQVENIDTVTVTNTQWAFVGALDQGVASADSVVFGDIETAGMITLPAVGAALVIASGAVTVTQAFHRIDTEGAAATDDLDQIDGGSDGNLLLIRQTSSARDVTIKDISGGSSNLILTADFDLGTPNSMLLLIHDGGFWFELTRSAN